MENYHKIIALDFDGCVVTNKYPEIGEPIEKNITKLKVEQSAGAKVILWTNRRGSYLDAAVAFCDDHGIHLDAVNANLPEIIEFFGGDTRKIYANEYWDDRAILMSEKDIGEFSDGYHTFNSLYHQRLILFAALVNTFQTLAWKSRKHFDGEVPFGGGWFVVGIDTPNGPYTYHFEDAGWALFHCKEVDMAPKWDGHTDKDVGRLSSLSDGPKDWADREVDLACQSERENSKDSDEWDYGVACYESALRAYRSLCRDNHSGHSIQITKSILNRLVDGKCLTPIEDASEAWSDVSDIGGLKNGEEQYQCNRMSSLFKKVSSDGVVSYSDVNRVYAVNADAPDVGYTNGMVTALVDKIYPITMPYLPSGKKFKVVREEFLVDSKFGDYDTVAFLYLVTPEGERVELNRYFKETESGMVPIEKAEYEERKTRKIK